MSEELIQYNIAYISALAAIIGAIIGALASLLSSWFSRKVIEAGKVEVFCKFVSSKAMHNEFGFIILEQQADYSWMCQCGLKLRILL